MTTSIIQEQGMWHVRIWVAGLLRFELWSSGGRQMAEAIARQEAAKLRLDSSAAVARAVAP